VDASRKPAKDAAARGKGPARVPPRRGAPLRAARAKAAEDAPEEDAPEAEGRSAAVDLASAPSSSSGRERPADGEDGSEGSDPAPEAEAALGEEAPAEAAEVAEADPDETEELPSPARAKPGKKERPERKAKTERNPAVKGAKPASGGSRRARAEADGSGDEPEGSPKERGDKGFQRGVSLGVKIALFTAVLVAACMGVLGWNLGATVTREIDQQINEKGVAAAKAFAFQPKAIIFQKALADDPAREAEIRAWQKSLVSFVEKEPMILNVMYFWDAQGKELVTDHGVSVLLAGVPPRGDSVATSKIAEKDKVEIEEGQYKGSGFEGRVRKYVMKVEPVRAEAQLKQTDPTGLTDPDDDKAGKRDAEARASPVTDAWVHVFLKADEVDVVAEAVRSKILVLCTVAIGIAILLSIAVAAYLAMPLRALVEDMRVVAEGKLDHKTVPRSADEIGQAAYQFNEMTRSLRAAQKLEHERQAIEHELSIATEIQTKLLPERIPQIPGIDLFSFYLSAKEVGGDYYDFLVIDPTHLGIIVADVSGKGIPGAMVMTMVRSLLRLASHRETSPAETLKKVNRILAKDIRRGMFVTAIYAVLDVQRKRLTVASAGHNPMVFYEAATKTVRAVNPSGIALGFDKGRTFDENIREETLDLKTGDRCVVYTDGVVEAMSEKQEEYGMERFMEVVKEQAERSSKDFTNGVVEELEGHRGRGEQSDDITITTLRVE